MRSMSLAAAVAAALIGSTVALAGPAEKGSVPFACKVLNKAIEGTVIDHYTSAYLKALPNNCQQADRKPVQEQWEIELALGTGTTVFGGPSGYVKQVFCKNIVKQKGDPKFTSGWLTRDQSGADVACWALNKSPGDAQHKPLNETFAYWAKGRWNGYLHIVTPASGGGRGYIAFLLKRVTAQLPR